MRVSCLEPLGLNVTEGAKILGVSRQVLSNVVNCRARISADMAIRLAKAFGSTMETWIRLQAAYDVAQSTTSRDPFEATDRFPKDRTGIFAVNLKSMYERNLDLPASGTETFFL